MWPQLAPNWQGKPTLGGGKRHGAQKRHRREADTARQCFRAAPLHSMVPDSHKGNLAMTALSPENVAKSIARVPSTATKALKTLLARAKTLGVDTLVAAIEQELNLRGAFDLDAPTAQKHAAWAVRAANLTLADAIELAFREAPINSDERNLTVRIAKNPGIAYALLTSLHGKGDVGLILGHMIYERLGFFRPFIVDSKRMSDILFLRDDRGGPMTYRLTTEAQKAFLALGIV